MATTGREQQRDALMAMLASVADGRGGGVLVVGPPGVGLTAMLDDVADAATSLGLAVLRATGRISESHIDRAVIRELAAGEDDGTLARLLNDTADRALPAAVLGWASDRPPSAVIVDDIDHADEPSRAAITYLANRCGNIAVLVVVAAHTATAIEIGHESAVELGPLPTDALAEVVSERHAVSAQVAADVAEAADGIPLVALEIAKGLSSAQRDGRDPLPASLLTHVSIPHAFAEPVRTLPAETRRALCVAAAEPGGELRAIAGALATLGDSVDSIEPAEEAGLVTITDGRVAFDHPLRRNIAYHLLAAPSRRAAHRALATAFDAPQDAERRATQLSLGLVEPDESVAADFECVADAAERRGDHHDAIRWWRRAADLSPNSSEAARRRRRADRVGTGEADPIAGLTKAERRVAEVVGRGATNKEAAASLFVSVKTVDAHLQSIYRKLGIQKRAELAVLMTRLESREPVGKEPGR